MNPRRSRRFWWLSVALLLAGQVALIFLLSDYSAPTVRRPSPGPSLYLVKDSTNELLALSDPTLFALPHPRSFAGRAWLSKPSIPARSFEWTSELEWLSLPVGQLGQGFAQFLQTNRVEPLSALASLEPQLIQPELSSAPLFSQKSSIRIEGELRHRKLLSPLQPSSLPHTEPLTNTVIHLVVDDNGVPISAARLLPGSGSLKADQEAVALAWSARFESFVRSGPGRETNSSAGPKLMWGNLVFIWHTLPSTNSTSSP